MTTTRPRRSLLAVAALAAVALVLSGGPVGAHGGPVTLEEVDAVRDGDDVTLTVLFTYDNDGHGVEGGTVTAVVGEATPVTLDELDDPEGTYQGTLTAAPGEMIRISGLDPDGEVDSTELAAPAATETDPGTEPEPVVPENGDVTEPAAPEVTTETVAPDAEGITMPDDEGDDGLSPILLAVLIAALIAVVVTAVAVGRRGGPSTDDEGVHPVEPAPEDDLTPPEES